MPPRATIPRKPLITSQEPIFGLVPITAFSTSGGRAAKTESLDALFKKQAAVRTRSQSNPTAKTLREREYKGLQRAHHLLKERMRVRRNDNWKALQKPSQVVHPSICRLIKLPSKHISEYTEDERTLVSKTFKFLWNCYEDREALYYQKLWDG